MSNKDHDEIEAMESLGIELAKELYQRFVHEAPAFPGFDCPDDADRESFDRMVKFGVLVAACAALIETSKLVAKELIAEQDPATAAEYRRRVKACQDNEPYEPTESTGSDEEKKWN